MVLAVATLSCARASDHGPPSAPYRTTDTKPAALQDAIERWHEAEDIEPLAQYVAAHPDADIGVWREVVALHRYDACDAARPDAHALSTVARQFPDTVAGHLAAITLLGDGVSRLHAEIPGPLVVDFLDGGDAWTRDAAGRTQVAPVEAEAVRRERTPALQAELAAALVADGCNATMGYCTWWMSRYPSDPQSVAIADAKAKTWYRRGHPTWRGGEHARCALRCTKRCKERASALDDSCYQPCYSRC